MRLAMRYVGQISLLYIFSTVYTAFTVLSVRNAMEQLLKKPKNASKKQITKIKKLQVVNNAKRTPCFFFTQEGRCKDGNNCYFSHHSNKPGHPLEGSIKNWVENSDGTRGLTTFKKWLNH